MDLIKTIVLGIVEGLTEFLPVSSTGHLILCDRWMGNLVNAEFAKTFDIFIQIGAIAAVVIYFRQRIWGLLTGQRSAAETSYESSGLAHTSTAVAEATSTSNRLHVIWMIVLATLPLGVAFVAQKATEKYMETPMVIAAALAIGGIIMALIELARPRPRTQSMEQMTWKQSLVIGSCQVLAAVFPGTSRSAATIMPAMMAGMSRQAAAEFSFFLAIPAMCAACGYKLLKYVHDLHKNHQSIPMQQVLLLTVGTLVSFVVAWMVIAGFMRFIRGHNFMLFAIYRIILGVVVILVLR